jgi:hypothetical protein
MLPDEQPANSTPSVQTERLHHLAHQLILMRETGPKSAAWHRARTRMLWRLQRQIARPRYDSPPQPTDASAAAQQPNSATERMS